MRVASLVLLLAVATPVLAQIGGGSIPDTTSVERYFPLEVGNWWEYRLRIEYVPPECGQSCTFFVQREVTGDSTLNGTDYRVVESRTFTSDGVPYTGLFSSAPLQLLRIDTLAAKILQGYPGGEEPWRILNCRFDTPFPTEYLEMPCDSGAAWVTGEGYERTVMIANEEVVTPVKSFYVYIGGGSRFAADIGLVSNEGCEGGCSYFNLIHARVGRVEYGTPSGVANEPQTPAPDHLSLTVYPNPTIKTITLSLAAPSPQEGRIEVFDTLGRRIHSEAAVLGQTTRRSIDTSGWPSGVYVVRVSTPDGATSTVQVLKR